jgi:dihydrodipicolinate reductase
MKLFISGIDNPMGRLVQESAPEDIEVIGGKMASLDSLKEAIRESGADVVLIFNDDPVAAAEHALVAGHLNIPVLVDNSDMNSGQHETLKVVSTRVPVLGSNDFSVDIDDSFPGYISEASALGALKVAQWILGKGKAVYAMLDFRCLGHSPLEV